jgi:hypothetical protein
MFRRVLTSSLLLLLLAALLLSGRGLFSTADDPSVLEQRAKFLLDTEPDGGRAVLDVREEYKKPDQVVIIGKIGGVQNPWSKGRAGFVMIDPDEADHDAENCSEPDCPHCARLKQKRLLKATALVEFVEDGQVVPIDARKLFRLKEGQLVVVRGQAKLNDDNLVIEANGLYVRE